MEESKKVEANILQNFTDDQGYIGTISNGKLDFGDGAALLGRYYVWRYFAYPETRYVDRVHLLDKVYDLRYFHKNKWQWRRHHDLSIWTGKPWTMSRDNLTPLMNALILYSSCSGQCEIEIRQILYSIKKRWGFLWNYYPIGFQQYDEPKLPDFMSPLYRKQVEIRSRAAVAKKISLKHRVALWVLDLAPLIQSIIQVWKSTKDDKKHDVSDDINHQVELLVRQEIHSTPTLKLAIWIYDKRRTASPPWMKERYEGYGPQTALLTYYGNGGPRFDLLYKPLIDKYIRRGA